MMLLTIASATLLLGHATAAPRLPKNISSHIIDAAAARLLDFNRTSDLGIVNGRPTLEGEWTGTVMVIGSNGDCEDSGLCTGMFIHPEIVMSAGHCCAAGERL
jgi:secreted trypsin-like serine protease